MQIFFLFFIYLSWGLECEPGLNSVQITLTEINGAQLYDVQLKPTYRQFFFISVTHELASESFQIPDLIPDTNYDIRVRTKNSTDWSDFIQFTSCKTNSPSVDQVCNITAIQNGQDYIILKWDEPSNKPDFYSIKLLFHPSHEMDIKSSKPTIKIGSLAFGTSINVIITTEYFDHVGARSEPYITKTLGSQSKFMNVYRISEECTNCEIDFLYNHDSGDLAADMCFVTYANHNFEPQFPTSVTTQYCVEYFDQPWALYTSCNGKKTTEYTCVCNNKIDREIGRLNTTSCHGSFGASCDDCTAENMTYSNSMIGRMPVYFPWPEFDHKTGNITVLPKNESTLVGHWFSTPSDAECSEIDTVGKNGCFWKRHSRQVFVYGQEFIDAGLKYKDVNHSDFSALKKNIQIAQNLFVEESDRCCGC